MRRKFGITPVLAGILGLTLCGMSHAATVTVNLGSAAGADVYGPLTTDPAGIPPSGLSAGSATELSPVPTGWPTASTDTNLGSAVWITNPTLPPDTTSTSYSLFEDSFIPPCTASTMAGTLTTSANNSEMIYLNNVGVNAGGSAPSEADVTFTPIQGVNTLGFDVTTNGVTTTNPVGLIYNAVLTYTVPNVVWRPPLNTGRRILKYGSTLPIKFQLRTDAGRFLKTPQEVNLIITGPSGELVGFSSGAGLKFARGNGQYLSVFHSKQYSMAAGVNYAINVVDSCSGTVLGTFPFQVTQPPTPHHHGKK